MDKKTAETASDLALLRGVFGLRDGDKLSDFVKEVTPVRADTAFIAEVRAYAVANAS